MVTKTESGRRASESWKISPYRTIGGQQNLHISEDAQCFLSVSVLGMTLEHYLKLVSKILHIWAEQKLTIEGKTKLMISWSTTFLPSSRTDLADHSFWNVQKTTVGCSRNQGESSKEVPKLIRTLKKKGHGNLWKVMWKVEYGGWMVDGGVLWMDGGWWSMVEYGGWMVDGWWVDGGWCMIHDSWCTMDDGWW